MIRIWIVVSAFAMALSLVGELRAQVTGDLAVEVTDGGQPLTGVQISQLVNGVKTRRATTDGDGQAAPPAEDFDFDPGEMVSVWIRRCEDGEVELILVAEGEDDPCVDEAAQAGEGCGCEKLGAFVWGDGDLVVDIGARTVSFTPGPATTTPPVGWRDLTSFGFTFGGTYWPKFEDTAGMATGATGADATTWSPSYGGFVETGVPNTGLRFGVNFQFSQLDSEVQFGNQTQTGDFSFYALGPYGRWEFGGDHARTSAYLLGGGLYSVNDADFSFDGGPPVGRRHETWRLDVGGGVVHWINARVGTWGEVHYSPRVGDHDADEHVRINVGVSFRPMWKACNASCIQ